MSFDSDLKKEITASMKEAMKSKNKEKLNTIRLILSAIKQVEVDERKQLSDQDIMQILGKMLKQRKESIKQFEVANRDDLVKKESFEIKIINEFLPEPLSKEELTDIISLTIKEANASSIKDMGKVMNLIRPKVQGKADMSEVSKYIKESLSSTN